MNTNFKICKKSYLYGKQKTLIFQNSKLGVNCNKLNLKYEVHFKNNAHKSAAIFWGMEKLQTKI